MTVRELFEKFESADYFKISLWEVNKMIGKDFSVDDVTRYDGRYNEWKDAEVYSWTVQDDEDEEGEPENSMNKEQFMYYITENYSISGEAHRLIGNILDFVANHYYSEDDQYNALCELLDGTIGLSDNEIKKIVL